MIKTALNSKLGKKLVVTVLLISSVITTFFTLISFVIDYRNETNYLNSIFEQIDKSYKNSMVTSLWEEDDAQIKQQAVGILNIRDIIEVKIMDDSDELIFKQRLDDISEREFEFSEENKFLLSHEGESIGVLLITATRYNMYLRLLEKMIYFFLTQGVKTLTVSICILWLFYLIVTSHIIYLTGFLSKSSFEEKIERISSKESIFRQKNEISTLANYLNDLIDKLNHFVAEKKEVISEQSDKIDKQKEMLMHSAQLSLLGEMAGGIAHEINNPLAIIEGNIRILEHYHESIDFNKDKQKEFDLRLSKIKKMTNRISSIVSGLRYFSRDANQDELERINVKTLVKMTLDLCQEKIKTQKIDIILKIENEDLEFNCRPVQISQVLLNLISNSYAVIKGTESPQIILEVNRHESGDIRICVKDNGPGIPKELEQKVFEPFFTTKPIGQGTGLGLSISKGIIDSHNGKFYLSHEENWTSFIFELPYG